MYPNWQASATQLAQATSLLPVTELRPVHWRKRESAHDGERADCYVFTSNHAQVQTPKCCDLEGMETRTSGQRCFGHVFASCFGLRVCLVHVHVGQINIVTSPLSPPHLLLFLHISFAISRPSPIRRHLIDCLRPIPSPCKAVLLPLFRANAARSKSVHTSLHQVLKRSNLDIYDMPTRRIIPRQSLLLRFPIRSLSPHPPPSPSVNNPPRVPVRCTFSVFIARCEILCIYVLCLFLLLSFSHRRPISSPPAPSVHSSLHIFTSGIPIPSLLLGLSFVLGVIRFVLIPFSPSYVHLLFLSRRL